VARAVALVVLTGALAAPALAAPGALDRSFGNQGVVVTRWNDPATATDILALPDGKVVVAGLVDDSTGANERRRPRIAVVRYRADGRLDPTWGRRGRATVAFGSRNTDAWLPVAALQPDGKVVVAASTYRGPVNVARFDRRGRLDSTFSGDGKTSFALARGEAFTSDLEVAANGTILVAGAVDGGAGLVRLLPEGGPDPSFGIGGRSRIAFPGPAIGPQPRVRTALEPDGDVLVGGTTTGGLEGIAVVRLRADGSRDRAFGRDGIGLVPRAKLGDLVLQPDGRILLGAIDAWPDRRTCCSPAVMRLLADGSADRGFGWDGRVLLGRDKPDYLEPFGPQFENSMELALEPGGRIVVAGGASYEDFTGNVVVGRLTQDGRPDLGWDTNGSTTTEVTGFFGDDLALAVAIQPGGEVVVAGKTEKLRGGIAHPSRFAVVRYLGGDVGVRSTRVAFALRTRRGARRCAAGECVRTRCTPFELTGSAPGAATAPRRGSVIAYFFVWRGGPQRWELVRRRSARLDVRRAFRITVPAGFLGRSRWRVRASVSATAATRRVTSDYVYLTIVRSRVRCGGRAGLSPAPIRTNE
jgi:uncharacterized delta-60 repeat protein